MDYFRKVVQWLLYSSSNPEKLSLTLKAVIPFLVLFNIGDVDTLGNTFDAVINFTVMTGTWVAGAMTLFGAVRKLWYTVAPR